MAEIMSHIEEIVITAPIFRNVQFGHKKEVICVYDFAVDTGAVGTYALCQLQNNTVITNVLIDIITAFVTTSNDGTISLGINSAVDLLNTVDADTIGAAGAIAAGIPVGTAGSAVKVTTTGDVYLTIATHAVTAGKVIIHIEYFEGGE